ncbi:microtubule-destabilizing protein 60-like [Vicia villosa]|uniref:microtubule-destabilizing protein 60-like n=1 Tax=Vicia villosa TaxID=3911 RepID=UPI00273B6E47|nr:microtubule-destabilizing protein 60-like [Vicia villosa]
MSPEKPSHSENLNPNMCNRDNCVNVVLHQNRIGRRKFVVAKKKKKSQCFEKIRVLCKCKENSDGGKCVCEAYENLRASQEGFFEKEKIFDEGEVKEEEKVENVLEEVIEANLIIHDVGNEERKLDDGEDDEDGKGCCHTAMVKRRRERVLEEARNSVPENGKVMHLVKAFERLLSINSCKEKEENEDEDEKKKRVMKWALPGLQFQREVNECETEQVDGCSDEMFNCVLTSEQLGLDQRSSVSSSWDCGNGSVCGRNSSGGRRSRRSSLESSSVVGGRRWKKKQKLKITSQKPFKLRTEQRGKMKEEQLMKKVKDILTEEEKLRIPIAQGLPWTIDEPECLIKPPVKESTKPIDVKLHSDMRAIDRAEFDQQVAEKLSLIEQQKMEMERQQKLAEEEEIRRLRKELIPKAQPMPYFDRPFIPRRSMKHPTIPREPKFHIPHHKKIKCLSLNEMKSYSSYFN